MSHLTKINKQYNEDHPPPSDKITDLIRVSDSELERSICNVRIPYEDMGEKRCTTVDALLLLASGMKPSEVAQLISQRYKLDYNITSVYEAKRNHQDAFLKMQVFYRDIFLNQQIQGMEQMCLQKLSMALVDTQPRTIKECETLTKMLESFSRIRKNKEESGDNGGVTREQMEKLEGSMRALLGKKA